MDQYLMGVDRLQFQKYRDEWKAKQCEFAGIKLISIPFWWHGDKESLAATILQVYSPFIYYNEDQSCYFQRNIPI
jgi:hypothetical protein